MNAIPASAVAGIYMFGIDGLPRVLQDYTRLEAISAACLGDLDGIGTWTWLTWHCC